MISNQDIQNSRILIIDDTPANISMLEQMLAQLKYNNLKSLTDPRQAAPTFSEFKPDLVLLDIMMPHLDGFGVMAKLKVLDPQGTVPILVLTANADQATRLRALEAGCRDFLTKPFNFLEITLRIRNLLEVRALQAAMVEHIDFLETTVRERSVDLLSARELLKKEQARMPGAQRSAQVG